MREPRAGGARTETPTTPRAAPTLRQMRPEDVDDIMRLERAAFPGIPDERLWKRDQVAAHVERFPEGQWVATLDGRIVGSCMNMRTTWARATRQHSWMGITGQGRLREHLPDGDVLYGTEIMVHPDARRRGLGRTMFERRYRYVVENGLRAFVTGGRLPGFAAHVGRYKCDEYVAAVARGDLTDPVLTPELKWGLTPIGVLCDYMFDPESLHHATLVAWENPDWTE